MAIEENGVARLSARHLAYQLIEKLSKTTIRKGVVTIADQAIVSAVNFLTGVIIARACSKEELGLYTLGFSIMLFVLIIQGSLICTPYMVYSPKFTGKKLSNYTTNILVHQICMAVLVIIFLVIGSTLLAAEYGPTGLAPVVQTLAVVIAFVTSREFVRQLSFAWLDIPKAFLLDACVAIIQISGLLFLVFQGALSASHAYYVSGIACGLSTAGWFYLQRRHFTIPAFGALDDFRRNLLLGKWSLAGGLANVACIQAYPWILSFFYGNAATGSLTACLSIVLIVNPVIIGMSNFLAPKITHALANGGIEEVRRILTKATLLFLAFMSCLSLVMLFFGGSILRMVYGSKFAGLDAVVGILALGLSAEIVSLPLGCSLFVMGRPDAGFKSYLIALFITFTLGLWLVKSYGLIGVALSLLISYTTAALYRWAAYRKLIAITKTWGRR